MSNKQRFEYFSRTIPSDHYQTLAMTKIVLRLGWKYISIVYEESNYGIKVRRKGGGTASLRNTESRKKALPTIPRLCELDPATAEDHAI